MVSPDDLKTFIELVGEHEVNGKKIKDLTIAEMAEWEEDVKKAHKKKLVDIMAKDAMTQELTLHPVIPEHLIRRFLVLHSHQRDVLLLPGHYRGSNVAVIAIKVKLEDVPEEHKDDFLKAIPKLEDLPPGVEKIDMVAMSPIAIILDEDMATELKITVPHNDERLKIFDRRGNPHNDKESVEGAGSYPGYL